MEISSSAVIRIIRRRRPSPMLDVVIVVPTRKPLLYRPIVRHHHQRGWKKMMMIEWLNLLLVLLLVLILHPHQRVHIVFKSIFVSAQAAGFCHRPNIKPNFVNEDHNVGDLWSTTTTTTIMNDASNNIFVIAHRGASYHIPIEHSLPAYRLALELNSHYIEIDIAISKDGILFPMHSMDLTITTNILNSSFVMIEQRQPWFSPYINRSSYWSFNFTFAELQTLTLQQRKNTDSPSSSSFTSSNETPSQTERTNLYDHLFTIPSLDDVVHLLVDWNINEIPKLHSNRTTRIQPNTDNTNTNNNQNYYYNDYERYKAGMYLEFKNTDWIQTDTGYNVVEVLFTQITQRLLSETSSSSSNRRYTWKDLFTCHERIRFDEYMIPPLILQSFRNNDLLVFHNLWHDYMIPNFVDASMTTNQLSTIAPEPLYVVLVDTPQCYDNNFWYLISNDLYRSFINGIGCHKNCILPLTIPTSSSNASSSSASSKQIMTIEEQRDEIAAIMERIAELQMVLHVWTERPEISYLVDPFRTVMDEIYYLKCNVSHVHGIFTESVDMAIRALQIPCPTTTSAMSNKNSGGIVPQQTSSICNTKQDEKRISIVVVLVSFLSGTIVMVIMNRFRNSRSNTISNTTTINPSNTKNAYQHATTIITSNDDDNDSYDRNGFSDDPTKNGLELTIT